MKKIVGFALVLTAFLAFLLLGSVSITANASDIKKKNVIIVSQPEYLKWIAEEALHKIDGLKLYDRNLTPSKTKIDYIVEVRGAFCEIGGCCSRFECTEKATVTVHVRIVCATNGRIYNSAIGKASFISHRQGCHTQDYKNLKFEAIRQAITIAINAIKWP